MRCEIERAIFAESLNSVIGALPTRTTYPVLQNILLEVADQKLTLAATDLDSYIRKEIPLIAGSKIEPGKVILPGRKLLETCREITADKLTLWTEENNIRLQSGPSDFLFAGLDPAEYPEPPAPPTGSTLRLPVDLLLNAYEATNFAVSYDEGRPAMCGLYWQVKPKEMTMVATDGYRLALVKKSGDFAGKVSAIIPPKVFNLLPRDEAEVLITLDQTKISFVFSHTTVISRLIEGPYPDYERVVPKEQPNLLRANREHLTAALRRTAIFAHPMGRLVTLELSNQGLSLFAQAPEIGSATEKLACHYKGSDLKIGFNVNYLLEILRHIETEEV
ncbi:MAG: DNA polymerase III subunit beta, partial [candidate division WOR-3 bacterium]